MQLWERVRHANGNRSYWIEGKRVSREAFEDAKAGRRLSCFTTEITKNFTRHYCVAD